MQTRVHAAFDPLILKRIDKEVAKTDTSRAQWLSDTISAYLGLIDASPSGDIAQEMRDLRTTNETLWRENKKLKGIADEAAASMPRLQSEIAVLKDQYAATFKELETLRNDITLKDVNFTHAKDTITQKDQEIAFLQAHIAQLTQSISQLALPPSQEEARAKHWYQFWK